MNLTLAVVNASFTKSQKESQAQDKEKVDQAKDVAPENFDDNVNDALQQDINNDEEIGFAQFMIAKRYARRMIAFLRKRQAEKK